MKVSVVVPVYNPGGDIDDCIRSVTDQSLPADAYEAIFVDDGSTDGTPERLDALAAEHAHVRVEHIPNSGWPGRPRNVGLQLARGDYVYFADNDDWLDREALERMHARAVADAADIVVGKVVGHSKPVPRGLFARNVTGATVEWAPLLRLLTPHKLFRRAMLDEHGIRFPEGRRRLEDHVFVMHAYFHATRGISVLADHPCYHWVLRRRRDNASYAPPDAASYYANVREVLRVIEEHTEPGPLRDALLAHWYRGKMLRRVGGRSFLYREPDYRRAVYDEVRALALERWGEGVDAHLPFHLRVRSALLRRGDYEGLHALARFEMRLRGDATAVRIHRRRRRVLVEIEAGLGSRRAPLAFREAPGGGLVWEPPEDLRAGLGGVDLRAAEEGPSFVLAHDAASDAEYPLPVSARRRLMPAGDGAVRPVLDLTARIRPRRAAGGAPLPAGQWELRAVLRLAGFSATVPVHRPGSEAPVALTVDGRGRITAVGTGRRAPLGVRVREALPPWLRRLGARVR